MGKRIAQQHMSTRKCGNLLEDVLKAHADTRFGHKKKPTNKKTKSDGTMKSATHYNLPTGCTELYELINYKNMGGNVAEAFRALYRLGETSHSDALRDLNKAIAYCKMEIERIKKYEV